MDSSTTLAALLEVYSTHRPREGATLRTILRTLVLPGLGLARHNGNAPAYDGLPAALLYGAMTRDRCAWSAAVSSKAAPGETYQKAYLRAIKRLVTFGESQHLLHPDEYEISPDWRALLEPLGRALATLPRAKRSALRSAFRRLARWATAAHIEPPKIDGDRISARELDGFRANLSHSRRSDLFRARRAWCMLAESRPDLALAPWPAARERRGIPPLAWPEALHRGIVDLFEREGLGTWSQQTRSGYEQRVAAYLGCLRRLGLDLPGIFAGVEDGKAALRLMFQGLPPGFPGRPAQVHAHELAHDPGYRPQLVAAMAALDGAYDGRASDANPLLVAALACLVESGNPASAAGLLTKAIAINRGFLGMTDRHTLWLTERSRLLAQAMKRRPSRYANKKRTAFQNPRLWVELVKARSKVRGHTLGLESAWKQDKKNRFKARAWAVALRNEVVFGFFLCYPIRVGNFSTLRLGDHYDPAGHRITIPAEETKNGREIDYELPIGGALGDMRDLMNRYLAEARPLLLGGRQSDHVFVGSEKGLPWLSCKTFHAILADISRRFLGGVLPNGIAALNPHLLRHVAATYHLAIGQNLNLAAQLLNDAPSTITRSYADVLENRKEATRQFLSGFNL
ncbi:MAG: site-specific integrase [Candidatus Sericytochromatia bacterium]|nr:site-specific integrase [Candidatus Tanganyikabacteria bacterium]